MKKHWQSVSDSYLLSVELTTDDPEQLDNLTSTLPQGPEEPFVEFGYDLRGLERERIRCTHCHQPHLAGVVVNKGGKRFLVGHICGAHIYGANFAIIKRDYEEAVLRQDVLRRAENVRTVIDPFLQWIQQVSESGIFQLNEDFRYQFRKRLPWLWDTLKYHTNNAGGTFGKLQLPKTLFDGFTDPHRSFSAAAAEISKSAMLIVSKVEHSKQIGGTIDRLQVQVGKIEQAIKQLEEVEQFFQPNFVAALCQTATRKDHHSRYEAGQTSITCVSGTISKTVRRPSNYKLPNSGPISAFRAAVSNLDLE